MKENELSRLPISDHFKSVHPIPGLQQWRKVYYIDSSGHVKGSFSYISLQMSALNALCLWGATSTDQTSGNHRDTSSV
jgi:hypothetical protein